ncbi:unnamed protein product [Echinostoma caproni]|uniref:Uncharacterized protein n=1 Tax=Echinostoma caproni TaxID=27848 RepID=A0A183AUT2_9TREM|nr:unnamed protein product [Echinostoma caproni]
MQNDQIMVKLKVLEGSRRLNSDDPDDLDDPRTLELGWTSRVTAIAYAVCRWSAEQSMMLSATREYVRVRPKLRQTTEPLLIFLARTRLIRNRMCCLRCPRYPFMYLIRCDEHLDGWQWRCPRCQRCRSIRSGSRLLRCRISLHALLDSIYFWCHKSVTDSSVRKLLPELWWSRIRFICLLDTCHSQTTQPSPAPPVRSGGVRSTKSRYRRPRLSEASVPVGICDTSLR